METMILGLAIFFAIHLLPTFSLLRNVLCLKFGEKLYKGIFSLIALAGLVLVVIGKGEAEFIPVWEPKAWSYMVTNACMLLALYSLIAFKMQSNLKRFTAHPMLLGILFWSGGHLFTNGDQASMILFGSFLLYSLVGMASGSLRGARPGKRRVPYGYDAMILVVAAVAYVALANFHAYFTGITLIR